VEEISTFYRRYHSIRFVGRVMAMRLNSSISAEHLEQIQTRFSDLLSEGRFELRAALEEELDEPTITNLPRLVFPFNRRSAGRLRQLIDYVNSL
jgi:hypothetical protein